MKKLALTHSARSAASTASVVPGHGPSSKVSTTSFGPSGRVTGKCLRPTAGVVAGSTASVRAVPSLPVQSAANAGTAASVSAVPSAAAIQVRFIAARHVPIAGAKASRAVTFASETGAAYKPAET